MITNSFVAYITVCLFGVLVGLSEIVSRYRDEPAQAILSPPGILYILVNIGAACLALYVIDIFKWDFGVDVSTSSVEAVRLIQVMMAGFGSIALFRSSLLTVRVGDKDLNVGPSAVLQTLLNAITSAVDRNRAQSRAEDIIKTMRNMTFDEVKTALPSICFGLMQNLNDESIENARAELENLTKDPNLDSDTKIKCLGLTLMNVVGPNVLEDAVKVLKAPTSVNP